MKKPGLNPARSTHKIHGLWISAYPKLARMREGCDITVRCGDPDWEKLKGEQLNIHVGLRAIKFKDEILPNVTVKMF